MVYVILESVQGPRHDEWLAPRVYQQLYTEQFFETAEQAEAWIENVVWPSILKEELRGAEQRAHERFENLKNTLNVTEMIKAGAQ